MNNELYDQALEKRVSSLQRFWFVADAPMFIDGEMLERLHDAIFRPEVEFASQSEVTTNEWAGKLEGTLNSAAGVEFQLPPVLALFGLDIAKAKADVEASLSGEGSGRRARSGTTTYVAVKSAERHLESLISLYLEKYSDRIFWISNPGEGGYSLKAPSDLQTWDDMEQVLSRPGARPLVVLDLDRGSRIMPMQGELTNGKDCELMKDYLAERARRIEDYPLPKYPSGKKTPEVESKERTAFWQEINERFESQAVLRSIESAAGSERARFDWIDFRVLLGGMSGPQPIQPPHLHFVGRGAYSAGTFAYQLVRRAERFGVRIVGTLKKGQDINVLAVYER